MVSRMNYVTISLLVLILAFLFLFTGVAKQALNEYDVNAYEETPSDLTQDSMFLAQGNPDAAFSKEGRSCVVFIGDDDAEEYRQVAEWWCTYSKKSLECYSSLEKWKSKDNQLPQAVVLDGRSLSVKKDLPVLQELTEKGVHLIFARLPEVSVLEKNPSFCSFLGISNIPAEQTEVSGIHLFEGFLLGGERIYQAKEGEEERQDMELIMPWYQIGSGTKTYLMGMLEEDQYKDEEMPAIVWRKKEGNANIFCVNGDYLSRMYGIGFYSAMMAEADWYEIHPIVNAQCMTVADFAGFTEENQEQLTQIYNQSQKALFQDTIWPALISITQRTGARMTVMTAPQLDYTAQEEPDKQQLIYYLKLLKEEYAEAGISCGRISETPLEEKFAKDASFYQESASGGYGYLALYTDNLQELSETDYRTYYPKLRTVAAAREETGAVITYLEKEITLQRATSVAKQHTFTDDLALMSYETALGYSNVVLDMKEVSYPQDTLGHWQNLSREISRNLCTYWKDYEKLSQTTLTESNSRIRSFLASDYRTEERAEEIVLHTDIQGDTAWFLLKLNGREPGKIQGGTLQELGGGYYLIETSEEEVTLAIKEESKTFA